MALVFIAFPYCDLGLASRLPITETASSREGGMLGQGGAFLFLFLPSFSSSPLYPFSSSKSSAPPFSASIVPFFLLSYGRGVWCLLTLYCRLFSIGFKFKSRSRFFSSSKRVRLSPFAQYALRRLGCDLVPRDFQGADSGVQNTMYLDSGSR